MGTWTEQRKNWRSGEQPYWIRGMNVSRPALASPWKYKCKCIYKYKIPVAGAPGGLEIQ